MSYSRRTWFLFNSLNSPPTPQLASNSLNLPPTPLLQPSRNLYQQPSPNVYHPVVLPRPHILSAGRLKPEFKFPGVRDHGGGRCSDSYTAAAPVLGYTTVTPPGRPSHYRAGPAGGCGRASDGSVTESGPGSPAEVTPAR
eukprot:762493-Hanusia_phi.AAC.2